MTKSSGFDETPVSHAIFRVARTHKALAGRLLRPSGLHPGQELVMLTLWSRGPQRQVDLAAATDADAPSMTRTIARMEKAGLVRRTPSATDRRSMIVEATQASQAIRADVEHAWRELERVTVGQLTAAQVARVMKALETLERNLLRGAPGD